MVLVCKLLHLGFSGFSGVGAMRTGERDSIRVGLVVGGGGDHVGLVTTGWLVGWLI